LQSSASVAAVATAPAANPDTALVAKALGASGPLAAPDAPAPVLASSRFVLVGVVASGAQGAALIAVDGKPAKPFAVGATVGDDFVLQSVQPRQAVLGIGAVGSVPAGGQVLLAMPPVGDKKGL
jgi:general secretion pathway protein C